MFEKWWLDHFSFNSRVIDDGYTLFPVSCGISGNMTFVHSPPSESITDIVGWPYPPESTNKSAMHIECK